MKIVPLYSSSKGNLFYLEQGDTSILIDIGVSFKNIQLALQGIGKTLQDIDAILITHEHMDHIKGAKLICSKCNIPIHATTKTVEYLTNILPCGYPIIGHAYEESFQINDVTITPFETHHDAVMPCGYFIQSGIHSLTFATDLGYVDDTIFHYLSQSDFIILESNYDKIMLEYGDYPFRLKSRIKSRVGHLSNDDSACVVTEILKQNPNTTFVLSHLSDNNNTKEVAANTIFTSIQTEGILLCDNIHFATRDLSFEEYVL